MYRPTEEKVEREMRLWIQNGILNEEPWNSFMHFDGKKRFDKVTETLYLKVRKRLAAEIYKGHNHRVTTSSLKQNWLTPPWFINVVRRVGPIALDPCGNPQSFVHAWWTYYGLNHIDGLLSPWQIPEGTVCFANPEYGRTLHLWAAKMAAEGQKTNGHVIGLIPARTGTGYWEKYIWPYADAVCFWHGGSEFPSRISFYNLDGRPAKIGATFDAAVVYYGKGRDRFKDVFDKYGTVKELN